jgi:hypothetical protein
MALDLSNESKYQQKIDALRNTVRNDIDEMPQMVRAETYLQIEARLQREGEILKQEISEQTGIAVDKIIEIRVDTQRNKYFG